MHKSIALVSLLLALCCSLSWADGREQVWVGEITGRYWGDMSLAFAEETGGLVCRGKVDIKGEERCWSTFYSVGGPILSGQEDSFRIHGRLRCATNHKTEYTGMVTLEQLSEDKLLGKIRVDMNNNHYPSQVLTFDLAPEQDEADQAIQADAEQGGVDTSTLLGGQ